MAYLQGELDYDHVSKIVDHGGLCNLGWPETIRFKAELNLLVKFETTLTLDSFQHFLSSLSYAMIVLS